MSEREISQLLMLGVVGEELTEFERSAWQRYPPGGVILFSRNCIDPHKTRALVDELQEISIKSSGLPLIVAVDQEGGPVVRLKAGFPDFPGAKILGADADLEKTRTTAQALAKALLEIGINCNLAPVADLFQPASRVLRDRCFGENPELVAGQVKAYIKGLQSCGMAACVKHFPGHGTVVEDSHKMLPVSHLERSELAPHLIPFAAAIAADVKIMMAAHLKFPAIDSRSVPFSPLFLNEIARLELGFSGLIISDDLDMAAVADLPLVQVMVEGVKAGLDMALWGRNLKPVADPEPVLDGFCQNMQNCGLSKELLQVKMARVKCLRKDIMSELKIYG